MGDDNSIELRKAIGLPQAIALVVGIIIGSSIFVQPSSVTGLVPSVPGVIAVWAFSGLLTLLGAMVAARFAAIFQESGGVYLYLKESFSPMFGFLWGWAMFWVMHTGIMAAISVIFARYVAYFIPLTDLEVKFVAIACIWLLSTVNFLGVKKGSNLQLYFTILKVASIFLLIIVGFALGSRVPVHFAGTGTGGGGIELKNFLLAMIAGLFAFGGWHMVTYSSDETKNPRKTIPGALVIGTLIVTACYIALNTLYMYLLPVEKVASSTRIAADAAESIFGTGGGGIMAALVIISTFSAVNGVILSGPRVYFAMTRDRLLFKWMGAIHPRFRTPARAILLQAVWAAVLILTGTYRELFTRVVYIEWLFFGFMAIGLISLTRNRGFKKDYNRGGGLIIPVIFSIFSFAIVINQVITDPAESLTGLLLVFAGIPVFYIWLKKPKKI